MNELIREEVMNAIGEHPNRHLIDILLETEHSALALVWTYEDYCDQLDALGQSPSVEDWEAVTALGFPVATKRVARVLDFKLQP